jgi:hypothetical protein
VRAVEALPGVGRAPLGLGLFIVRGGRPTDSRAFIHGLEVPQLYHFGGLRSVVPSDLVQSLDYLPGNFDSRYGRALAGVIDLTVRPGKRDRLHAAAELTVLDAGARVEGPLRRGSFLLAVRRSYIDGILALALPRSGRFALTTAPAYWDYQARLDLPLSGGQLRLFAYGSDDRLTFAVRDPLGDIELRGRFDTRVWFHRLEATYTRPVGPVRLLLQQATGVQHQGAEIGQVLSLSVTTLLSHWRLAATHRFASWLEATLGLDALVAYNWLDVTGPPPPALVDTNIRPSTQRKLATQGQSDTSGYGVYLHVSARPTRSLQLLPGVRVDAYRHLRRPGVDPRLTVLLSVHETTTLRAAVGLYSQPPQPYEADPTFGNPRLPLERAVQATIGADQTLPLGFSLSTSSFLRWQDPAVVPSTAYLQEPSGLVVPERYRGTGQGRVAGLEVLLRQRLPGRTFGWLSYTLLMSQRRAAPSLDEPWVRFDFDQTHVLTLAGHVELPWGLSAGARFRYLTGLPYTPLVARAYDADADLFRCAEAPLATNQARLPDYHQLDLRLDKRFVTRALTVALYLDVQNVYNRRNPEQARTAYDCREVAYLTGLFTLPVLGLRLEY